MKRFIIIIAALLAAQSIFAAQHKIDLPFDFIQLKNGKKLEHGIIKTYDSSTGRIIVFADRSATAVQLELLPDDISSAILSMSPDPEKDEKRAASAEKAQDRSSAAARARDDERRRAREESIAAAEQSEAQKRADQLRHREEAKALAESRAYKYYRYEMRPGSGSVTITAKDMYLEAPEEIQGWAGRLRFKGEIALEYYDSKGRSFNSMTSHFEVTTETKPDGGTQVVDFTPLR